MRMYFNEIFDNKLEILQSESNTESTMKWVLRNLYKMMSKNWHFTNIVLSHNCQGWTWIDSELIFSMNGSKQEKNRNQEEKGMLQCV